MSIAFSGQVFDDNVSGTSGEWYSPARYNDVLGSGDMLVVMASVSDVSGSSPSVTVAVQHSADGRNWVTLNTAISSGTIPSTGKSYRGDTEYWPTMLSFVRLKITLGGSSPKCRVKLFAASRELY